MSTDHPKRSLAAGVGATSLAYLIQPMPSKRKTYAEPAESSGTSSREAPMIIHWPQTATASPNWSPAPGSAGTSCWSWH